MIPVPFYNHYKESSPTIIGLNQTFWNEGIHLTNESCLCSLESKIQTSAVALVHGSRDITNPCYDEIKNYISTNPQTRFFILGFSLGFGTVAREKIKERIGNYPNYLPWTGADSKDCFQEIVRLAKAQQPL